MTIDSYTVWKAKYYLGIFLAITLVFTPTNYGYAGNLAHDPDQPAVGQFAPDFEITQLDGKQFRLSDYRGEKSVYLVFWNTWCTYCMKKVPMLKNVYGELSEDIRIIAVNTGLKDSVQASQAFQTQRNINYPLAFDHGKTVTDLYGVWGTPTEFIIDINGIIQHRDNIPHNLEVQLKTWNKPGI